MIVTDLPLFLTVDGEEKEIYSDFRNIVTIFMALEDSNVPNEERNVILLNNLYVDDWSTFTDIDTALKKAHWFVNGGKEYEKVNESSPRILSWEQDYNLICAAVNNKANTLDVRSLEYMHWWTFLGYLNERGECQFSTITDIRDKLNKGKKLEKYEKEILRENRDQIILKNKSKSTEDFKNELWGE